MKILQIHTRYRQPGGEDAVVDAEHALLTEAGHDVTQHIELNPAGSGAAAVSLGASGWNFGAQSRVGSVLDQVQPDIMHVHNTWFALSPSVLHAAQKRRIPIVMTLHNFRLGCANSLLMRDGRPCEDCLHGGAHHAVIHRCYRDSRAQSAVAAAGIGFHRRIGTWPRLVSRFISLSAFAQSRIKLLGIPDEKFIRGSNFVSDPGPRPAPPSSSDEIFFVGRISAEKGLKQLLDAWRQVPPGNLRLTILGDGPRRVALEQAAPPGVTFLGRVPGEDVRARLKRARAIVIPSTWYEGQPIVALEAMASGTPLVLSDIGGLPEILGETRAGLLTAPGDVRALQTRLGELLDDTLIDAIGVSARRRYEDAFTPALALRRLETAYSQVVRTPAE